MKYLLTLLLAWGSMVAVAFWLGSRFEWPAVLLIWSAAAAILCGFGALLLSRQPVGLATVSGQFGASLLRWGFQISRGQLPVALAVSWLVWAILGIGVIAAATSPDPATQVMIAAWVLDGFALLYLIGLLILARQAPRALPKAVFAPMLALVMMLAGSALLWLGHSESSRHAALLLAAGPQPVLGVAYTVFMGMMMVAGRKGGFR